MAHTRRPYTFAITTLYGPERDSHRWSGHVRTISFRRPVRRFHMTVERIKGQRQKREQQKLENFKLHEKRTIRWHNKFCRKRVQPLRIHKRMEFTNELETSHENNRVMELRVNVDKEKINKSFGHHSWAFQGPAEINRKKTLLFSLADTRIKGAWKEKATASGIFSFSLSRPSRHERCQTKRLKKKRIHQKIWSFFYQTAFLTSFSFSPGWKQWWLRQEGDVYALDGAKNSRKEKQTRYEHIVRASGTQSILQQKLLPRVYGSRHTKLFLFSFFLPLPQ